MQRKGMHVWSGRARRGCCVGEQRRAVNQRSSWDASFRRRSSWETSFRSGIPRHVNDKLVGAPRVRMDRGENQREAHRGEVRTVCAVHGREQPGAGSSRFNFSLLRARGRGPLYKQGPVWEKRRETKVSSPLIQSYHPASGWGGVGCICTPMTAPLEGAFVDLSCHLRSASLMAPCECDKEEK